MHWLWQLIRVEKNQLRQIVAQPSFAVKIAQIVHGSAKRDVQNSQLPRGGREGATSGQACFMPVRVKLHLTQQIAADQVPQQHQHPEHFSSQPDAKSRQVQDPANANIDAVRPLGQPIVPRIAFVDDTCKRFND